MHNYKEAFAYCIEGLYSHNSFIDEIQHISTYLMDNIVLNEKYVDCLTILLSSMMRVSIKLEKHVNNPSISL